MRLYIVSACRFRLQALTLQKFNMLGYMNHNGIPSWILLNAGRFTVGQEWNYKDVCSPFTRLYYVVSGSGHILLPDRHVKMEPDHMYIIPAYTRHSNRCDGQMDHYYLHVYEPDRGDSRLITDYWRFPEYLHGNAMCRQAFELLVDTNSSLSLYNIDPRQYDTHRSFIGMLEERNYSPLHLKLLNNSLISLIMSNWIKGAFPTAAGGGKRVARVRSYISSHLHEEITLDHLAEAVNTSKHHLSHIFKSETGQSPIYYIRALKMRKAQIELAHTEKLVKEIGFSLGYSDCNYFIRTFKQATGMSPSSYRRHILLTQKK